MSILTPDKIRTFNHIVTHENCPDGVASAMILKEVLPGAKVTFVNYNAKLLELPAEPGMIFCDCSPHRDRIQDFLDVDAVVLDHHKTAKDIVGRFADKGLGVFADEKLDVGVCGAVLAFREVWMPIKEYMGEGEYKDAFQRLATLAGIRDTWQKGDPRWREACEQADALTFWPWDRVEGTPWDQWPNILSIGPILFDRNIRRVDKAIEGAYKFTSGKNRKVTVFEGTKPTSDASEKLAGESDIVIGFSIFVEEGNPLIIYSTRTRSDFDCSSFCLAHGGGGHTKAAGFSQPLTASTLHPYAMIEGILNKYETFEVAWLNLLKTERDRVTQANPDGSVYESPVLTDPVSSYHMLVVEEGLKNLGYLERSA